MSTILGPQRQHRATRWRAAALVGVLVGLLGFAIAVQVRANSDDDNLSSLRQEDLVGILDDQNARSDRLRQQVADLQTELNELTAAGGNTEAAQKQAEQAQQTLDILLGVAPAQGPGVRVVITDPAHGLTGEQLLDVIEELRGAGAEAISFAGVRVGTDTAFTTDSSGTISIDGTPIAAPYTVQAIGEAKTLETALNIPGGIASVVRAAGGDLESTQLTSLQITVTRSLPAMSHARPAG